jgi:hypothetical protein
MNLDPVLAVGLPFAPIAFLAGSRRPVIGPSMFPPTTLRQRLAIALAVVVSCGALAVATATSAPGNGGWEADLAAFHVASEPTGLDGVDYELSVTATSAELLLDETTAQAFLARYPTISLEVWPSTVVDGHLMVAPAPIATATASTASSTQVSLEMPVYRTPMTVSVIFVGVAADGTRVALSGPDGPRQTPAWHGTLFDWWFGPR